MEFYDVRIDSANNHPTLESLDRHNITMKRAYWGSSHYVICVRDMLLFGCFQPPPHPPSAIDGVILVFIINPPRTN